MRTLSIGSLAAPAFGAALALAPAAVAADLGVPGDFPSIQAAVNAAADGDVVIVEPGTYVENVTLNGKAITVRSTDPSSAAVVAATILDAGGSGTALRIIFGETRLTVIDGLTITGGDAAQGGGLEIAIADPTIRRCVFTNNTATEGGAASLYETGALFDACRFIDNSASRGGAISLYSTNRVRFDDCHFENNSAERGGAFDAFFADLRLLNSTVVNNTASDRGGAYNGWHSQITLNSTLVAGNSAPYGGAFRFEDDGLRARNATIVDNVATSGTGGAGSGFFTQPVISNCIVRDNGDEPFAGINPAVRFSNVDFDTFGNDTIDADPQFLDQAAGDYRLQASSPSVNAGFNGWVASFDHRALDGTARIQDGTVDHGAFEVKGDLPPTFSGRGQLIAATQDTGALAYGTPQPLWLYDATADSWSKLVRDQPAAAITADDVNACFWVLAGDTGLLGRIPYDTLELEELGLVRLDGEINGPSYSGFAVRDGVLYATSGFTGTIYTIDPLRCRATEAFTLPGDYELWDIHYDAADDLFYVLSSAGSLPNDALGVITVDPVTLDATTIQQWFNDDPQNQAPALQGLAVGGGQHYIFRSLYNDLEVYDATSLTQTAALNVPGSTWVLGGLTWSDAFTPAAPLMGDVVVDCTVNFTDLVELLAHFGMTSGATWNHGDLDADEDVDFNDLLLLLGNFSSACSG